MQNENFALFSLNAFTRAPLPARLLCPLSMAKFKHNKETHHIYVYIFNTYTISVVNLQFKCRRGLFESHLHVSCVFLLCHLRYFDYFNIRSCNCLGGHRFGQQWHFDRLSTHIHRKHFDIDSWTGQQHLQHLVRPVHWWQISKTHYSHFWRKCGQRQTESATKENV